VHGTAAKEVWIDRQLLGRDGMPGASAAEEVPGRMDSVFYLPRELVKPGPNIVDLRLSAHHATIGLSAPMHYITIGDHGWLTGQPLRAYLPSIVLFGAFLVGVLFFAVRAVLGPSRVAPAALAVMAAFALAQLLAETARGWWAYPYPVHAVRLSLILFFAGGFGAGLIAYIAQRFQPQRAGRIVGATVLLTLLGILSTRGFDGMTAAALLLPALGGAVVTGFAARRDSSARWHFAALVGFIALALAAPYLFIDRYFFWIIAALLVFLFVQEARARAADRAAHAEALQRESRLKVALAQARERQNPGVLTLTNAGRTEIIPMVELIRLQAAGDYVELHVLGGKEILHHGTLAELEARLPSTFLRVHRSHLVNTARVTSLDRAASGTGTLRLDDGSEVPVSRRVMPKVRDTLATGEAG
jgi:DNA-binding LytR/AlgR family response regulator